MADSWFEAQLEMRRQMDRWIQRGIRDNDGLPWRGSHDEGTFAASWIEHYRLTGDETVGDFLRVLRADSLKWAGDNLLHGYWPKQEAHHGPETFMIFLARLWHLDPGDTRVVAALDHAAEHLGNWVPEIPAWYDWDNHRFRSWSLGTETVGERPEHDYNCADHFKLIQVALVAYLATRRDRYLQLASDYADAWVPLITGAPIPAILFPTDDIAGLKATYSDRTIAEAELSTADALERHVAAGSIDTLMDLFELSGEQRYCDTVGLMLQGLVPHVAETYADPLPPVFARYRLLSGDESFDRAILEAVEVPAEVPGEANVMMFDDALARHPMGLGRRRDAPKWGYRSPRGAVVEETGPSPAALMLRFQISGDIAAAQRALVLGGTRIKLGLDAGLDHGRDHGCGGTSMSAIAFGHGRSAGAGVAMTTLYPATLGARRFVNGAMLQLTYGDDEEFGLPAGCAALLHPGLDGHCELHLANTTEADVPLTVGPGDARTTLEAPQLAGEGIPQQREGRFRLLIPAGEEMLVTMQLSAQSPSTR